MVDAATMADERVVPFSRGKPGFVTGLIAEEGHGGNSHGRGQVHDARVGADVQVATLQYGRKLGDGDVRGQTQEADVVHCAGQLIEAMLFAFP